jgi:predicted MFS family arabinose efflux permease
VRGHDQSRGWRLGNSLSNAIGGVLIEHAGYVASFRGLAGIAIVAFFILSLAVPETLVRHQEEPLPLTPEHTLMSQATAVSPLEERPTI